VSVLRVLNAAAGIALSALPLAETAGSGDWAFAAVGTALAVAGAAVSARTRIPGTGGIATVCVVLLLLHAAWRDTSTPGLVIAEAAITAAYLLLARDLEMGAPTAALARNAVPFARAVAGAVGVVLIAELARSSNWPLAVTLSGIGAAVCLLFLAVVGPSRERRAAAGRTAPGTVPGRATPKQVA
jgi:hypothetical protein